MKLKNILLVTLAIIASSSCSHIDEDERYIYVKPAEIGRSVLIEDFTGQKCSNCPRATSTIESLQEQYGADNVIAVGIHSGPLGFAGDAKYVGLMTDTGNEYYNSNSIPSQPYGVINRTSKSGKDSEWGTIVYNEIQKTAPVGITLSNSYDESDRTATIDVTMLGINGVSGKLQVWLIEDGITAMQMIQDGTIDYDYTHNHVFREAVNGTWGEDVSVSEGETSTKRYTLTLNEKYVAANVSVVAFVYNDSGVQQVSKAPLINNNVTE